MKPLDKKQVPQVVAMVVLAVLFFGYFAVKMILPTPAAAGTHAAAPPPSATASGTAPRAGGVQKAADPAAAALVAPPPTAGLRDPFVQAISDQPAPPPAAPAPATVRPAALTHPVRPLTPSISPLPGPDFSVRPLPSASVPGLPRVAVPAAPPLPPAPPAWVVTGVLQSGADRVAILRSGEARRFVKQGDFVDSDFRVVSVTRDSVTLKHGNNRFTLPLGGAKAVPSARTVASPGGGGAEVSSEAPDFTLSTLGGKSVSLSSYRGRVVVLDFWASWCGWCKKGMPQVQALYNRHRTQGLSVLSVDSWDKRDAMQAFLQANPQYTTTMLFDPSPEALSVAGNLFGARKIPSTVVIDQKGRVADAFSGYSLAAGARLEAVLARLGLRRGGPETARAVRPRLGRPRAARPVLAASAPVRSFSGPARRPAARTALVAFTPRPVFSLSAPAFLPPSLPSVVVPKSVRRVAPRTPACPVVRVADDRAERVGALFPDRGHGLLPSGMPAPDFSLSTLGGQDVTLSQFQGSVVVVDFWASWDAGSVKALTWLQGVQKQAGPDNLTVLAVNSWDSKAAMQAALGDADWGMTMLFDPGVSNDSVAVRAYHAPDIPTFYVIDQQGRVAGAFVGAGANTTNSVKAVLAKLGVF